MKNTPFLSIIGIIAAIVIALVAYNQYNPNILGAGETIYRPVYGSIGCESTASLVRTPLLYFDESGVLVYLCTDTDCRIESINTVNTCNLFGISNHASSIDYKINGEPYKTCRIGTGYDDNWGACSPIFGQGDTITLKINCLIGSSYVPYEAYGVATYHKIQLYNYPDSGKFKVAGGEHCYTAQSKQTVATLQPSTSADLAKTAMWKTTQATTKVGEAVSPYFKANTEEGTTQINSKNFYYLPIGDYLPYIIDWVQISDYNTNVFTPSKGTYAGKTVLCDIGTGTRKIYLIESVPTMSGTSYRIPTTDLGTVQCCVNPDCFGNGYMCDTASTFTCVQSAQQGCVSDINCPDVKGMDSSGKPYARIGKCVNKVCQYTETAVECNFANDCPYKSGYYAECANYACLYTNQNQKVLCPYGSCCTGQGNYYARPNCDAGQTCCGSNGIIGTCRTGTTCGSQVCQTDAYCNDNNASTTDKCVSGKCVNAPVVAQTCEDKCKIEILGWKTNWQDPMCYGTCSFTALVNGVLKITEILIKFVMSGVVALLIALVFRTMMTPKTPKGRGKTQQNTLGISLLSVVIWGLTWLIIWVIIG
jgi:hypothetical protein